MNRKFLFLIPLLFLTTFSTASAENWKHIRSYGDKAAFYMDTDRIEKAEDTAIVWSKVEAPNKEVIHMKLKFYRKMHSYDTLYLEVYKPNQKEPLKMPVNPPQNKLIAPKSVMESIYNLVWPESSENWIPIPTEEIGYPFISIDGRRIEITGDTATIWTKEIYDNHHSQIVKHRLYKKSRMIEDLSITSYDEKGQMISEKNLVGKPKAIMPDTIPDLYYKLLWTSSDEKWVYLKDSGDVKEYIDVNSIVKNGNTATAWIKQGNDKSALYMEFIFYKDSPFMNATIFKVFNGEKLYDTGRITNPKLPIPPESAYELAYHMIWPDA